MSHPNRVEADGSAFDFRHIEAELARGYSDPFFIIDARLVREKARRFRAAMPRVFPHYAVKVNPTTGILAALHDEGIGFEIASRAAREPLIARLLDISNLRGTRHFYFAATQRATPKGN